VNIPKIIQQAIQYHEAGNLQQAETLYRKILAKHPDHPNTLYLLGTLAHQVGHHQSAIKLIKKAIIINSDDPNFYYNLGLVYVALNRPHDAIQNISMALQLKPDYVEAYNNLALIQQIQGNYEAAQKNYQLALQIKPDYLDARDNLLFLLSYHVLCSPRIMLKESQHWDRIHGRVGKTKFFTHSISGNPGKFPLAPSGVHKRLRIGYVSPDFWRHAVSYFLEPILAEHDRTQVEVFCYAEVTRPDDVTQRFQALADHWRSTVGLSDEALARLIYEDHIDILIDLAGHTANNRLKAFTYKPAPVQATYLGYFATTGLATMDYWITDETLHPQDTVELATESLFRLPRCCLAYQPLKAAPEIMPRSGKNVTFGSFNVLSKISPAAFALWSEILRATPEAQLMLKTKQLGDPVTRKFIQQQFANHGIGAERLILLSYTPSPQEHLATYGRVDIALDTIPRTGGSTTAEALWMGVPVISLAGERFIERLSASMLNAVGLDELIADSYEEYLAKAVALAADPQQLAQLRASLRERMAASPLCNAQGLAQTLESAYRNMWQQYLAAKV